MPFVLRTTETPDLATILELEQIVIVDKTGPSITVGISQGAACLVGEFLKGGFDPLEVSSGGQILSTYGTLSGILSQDIIGAAAVQDGTGGAYDGNGILQLKSKQFRRLILVRADTNMVTTDGGSTKAIVQFDVNIAASDEDPDDSTLTGRDIVIPAGTRFADAAIGTATKIVALSQDITIPKGTTIESPGIVIVDGTFENSNGTDGATAFFVKGTTAAIGDIDTCLDTALPNVDSTISTTDISTTTVAGAATAIFPPGTGATLKARIISRYEAAIGRTNPAQSPQNEITVIWAARRGSVIRQLLRDNVIMASGQGRGRMCAVSAEPAEGDTAANATAALTAAKALASGESLQVDRVSINFPYAQVFSSELGSVNVLVSPDGFKAMMFSQLAPEVQSGVPNTFLSVIQNPEPAFIAQPLTRADYVALKAAGVSALIKDVTTGWQFQSSVTAVNPVTYPTRVYDNRRRFADFYQDTLVGIAAKYQKFPGTTERIDAITAEIEAFNETLLSPNDVSAARIADAGVDAKNGNTPQLRGVGIFVIQIQVQMFGDLNDIVFETEIGPTVIVVRQVGG